MLTSTTVPATSGRFARVVSFASTSALLKPGLPEEVRISVFRPVIVGAVGALAWSFTPEQTLPCRVTWSVKFESGSNEPFLPWTRT